MKIKTVIALLFALLLAGCSAWGTTNPEETTMQTLVISDLPLADTTKPAFLIPETYPGASLMQGIEIATPEVEFNNAEDLDEAAQLDFFFKIVKAENLYPKRSYDWLDPVTGRCNVPVEAVEQVLADFLGERPFDPAKLDSFDAAKKAFVIDIIEEAEPKTVMIEPMTRAEANIVQVKAVFYSQSMQPEKTLVYTVALMDSSGKSYQYISVVKEN